MVVPSAGRYKDGTGREQWFSLGPLTVGAGFVRPKPDWLVFAAAALVSAARQTGTGLCVAQIAIGSAISPMIRTTIAAVC
ncbi:hypothetical protein [Nocardia sp. CA-120079]|uniref:hypothetical protein n=1 Tax=Nocardia sp. CA-120079 TaxID=3239974 RepID=UPI003D99C2D6